MGSAGSSSARAPTPSRGLTCGRSRSSRRWRGAADVRLVVAGPRDRPAHHGDPLVIAVRVPFCAGTEQNPPMADDRGRARDLPPGGAAPQRRAAGRSRGALRRADAAAASPPATARSRSAVRPARRRARGRGRPAPNVVELGPELAGSRAATWRSPPRRGRNAASRRGGRRGTRSPRSSGHLLAVDRSGRRDRRAWSSCARAAISAFWAERRLPPGRVSALPRAPGRLRRDRRAVGAAGLAVAARASRRAR